MSGSWCRRREWEISDVSEMSRRRLGDVWKLLGSLLGDVGKLSGRFLEVAKNISGICTGDVWEMSRMFWRCL